MKKIHVVLLALTVVLVAGIIAYSWDRKSAMDDTISGVMETVMAASCDDYNPCTTDRYLQGECQHTHVDDGTKCDDGNLCTDNDTCSGGACAAGTGIHYCGKKKICVAHFDSFGQVAFSGCEYDEDDDGRPDSEDTYSNYPSLWYMNFPSRQ